MWPPARTDARSGRRAAPRRRSWDLLFSLIYALANFYAIALFIWLLSHALVELPRRLWSVAAAVEGRDAARCSAARCRPRARAPSVRVWWAWVWVVGGRYLPDAETQERHACFLAGIAWEDLERARPDWEEAVEQMAVEQDAAEL